MGEFHQKMELQGLGLGSQVAIQKRLVRPFTAWERSCHSEIVRKVVPESKVILPRSLKTDMGPGQGYLSQEIHATNEIDLPKILVKVQHFNEGVPSINHQRRIGKAILRWVHTYIFWQNKGYPGQTVHVSPWDRVEQKIHVPRIELIQAVLGPWKLHSSS